MKDTKKKDGFDESGSSPPDTRSTRSNPTTPPPDQGRKPPAPNLAHLSSLSDEWQTLMISTERFLKHGATFTIIADDVISAFRISAPKWDEQRRFVSRIRGGEKNHYIGELNPATGHVSPTARSPEPDESDAFEILNSVLPRIWRDESLPAGMEFLPATTCTACSGTLTDPRSIKRRLGPVCSRRHDEANEKSFPDEVVFERAPELDEIGRRGL